MEIASDFRPQQLALKRHSFEQKLKRLTPAQKYVAQTLHFAFEFRRTDLAADCRHLEGHLQSKQRGLTKGSAIITFVFFFHDQHWLKSTFCLGDSLLVPLFRPFFQTKGFVSLRFQGKANARSCNRSCFELNPKSCWRWIVCHCVCCCNDLENHFQWKSSQKGYMETRTIIPNSVNLSSSVDIIKDRDSLSRFAESKKRTNLRYQQKSLDLNQREPHECLNTANHTNVWTPRTKRMFTS